MVFVPYVVVINNMDLETVQNFLGAALSHDVTKWTVALSIASWIHSSQMKGKFESVINSIDNLSKALSNQTSRINNVESRVDNLEKRG
jgi:hypothetical protein